MRGLKGNVRCSERDIFFNIHKCVCVCAFCNEINIHAIFAIMRRLIAISVWYTLAFDLNPYNV